MTKARVFLTVAAAVSAAALVWELTRFPTDLFGGVGDSIDPDHLAGVPTADELDRELAELTDEHAHPGGGGGGGNSAGGNSAGGGAGVPMLNRLDISEQDPGE